MAQEIEFAYEVNAKVEVLQPVGGRWEPATVIRHEPYLGQPGYRVQYDNARPIWDCHGGWTFEACMRAAPQVQT